MSPSVVPAFVLVGLLGRRILGRARDIDAAATYWLTAAAGIALSLVLLDREGHLIDAFALGILALLGRRVPVSTASRIAAASSRMSPIG